MSGAARVLRSARAASRRLEVASSGLLRGAGVAGWVVLCLTGCRVYRDEGHVHDVDQPASVAHVTETAVEGREPPAGPARDALNLWVLNRPKDDLPSPTGTTATRNTPSERNAAPAALVVVALGVGPATDCAPRLARRGAERLTNDNALQVVTALLESARRWRWPTGAGELSAIAKSSDGRVGGVQRIPAGAYSPALLLKALERQVLLGGQYASREVQALGSPALALSIPGCEAPPDAALEGPVGVLIRTVTGEFAGGLIAVEPPADAGVVSIPAQFGVGLAVGPAGGVLLVTNCAVPPPERIAERLYATPGWELAPTPRTLDDCRAGNLLLSPERAWTSADSPIAWGTAAPELSAPVAPPGSADAGAAPPEPGRLP